MTELQAFRVGGNWQPITWYAPVAEVAEVAEGLIDDDQDYQVRYCKVKTCGSGVDR